MKAPTFERTSAAKAGWVIIVLILAWLAFLFVPLPKEVKPAVVEIPAPPISSLQKAGLRDYTDWEGLPEIFAVWADKAEWKDGKTRFAYWHPVMKNYSYYFEAVRSGGNYRFREITEPLTEVGGYYLDESLGEDCPIRFYRSSELKKSLPASALVKPALVREKPEHLQIKIPANESTTVPVSPPAKP